jgi:hypothetical protein
MSVTKGSKRPAGFYWVRFTGGEWVPAEFNKDLGDGEWFVLASDDTCDDDAFEKIGKRIKRPRR